MSVLVYIESENGKFKKASYEAASYAKGVADQLGASVTAVTINAENNEVLGTYGVSKVLQVNNDQLSKFNADAYADVIAQAAKNEDAKVVVLGQTDLCGQLGIQADRLLNAASVDFLKCIGGVVEFGGVGNVVGRGV